MAVFFDLGFIGSISSAPFTGKGQSTPLFVPWGRNGFDDQNDKKNKVKASIWNEEPP